MINGKGWAEPLRGQKFKTEDDRHDALIEVLLRQTYQRVGVLQWGLIERAGKSITGMVIPAGYPEHRAARLLVRRGLLHTVTPLIEAKNTRQLRFDPPLYAYALSAPALTTWWLVR